MMYRNSAVINVNIFFVVISAVLSSAATAGDLVPFVIPGKANMSSPIAITSVEPIDTKAYRLVARKGHFYRGGKRVRLWGVNLSFGASMPKHEDAPVIAERLAAAGVNTVRCHHMDTSRWPRGLWNAKDGKGIAPEALDRLDYFIDQLAQRGICVNINLHVGREHSRFLGLPEPNRKYDKISNIFTPALIDAQKKFARELLTHVNKYRKVRYADDPAVAIVEVTNENSFFMWGSEETLRTLPEYYANILQGKYNAWLKGRYGMDQELQKVWGKGTEPLGENILKDGDFLIREVGGFIPQDWSLEQHEGCRAWMSRQRLESRRALKIDIEKSDDTEWHLQLNQGRLKVKKGRYYTIAFEAAADKERSITCSIGQAHSPWKNLGFSQRVELTRKRTTYRYGFTARADDDDARFSFAFGASDISIHLANVELRPGGRVTLGEDESIGNSRVKLYGESETPPRTLDRMRFLAETEKGYFDEMRNYVQKELGCKALVTGTIVFGPLGLYAQSDMDFIDAHAYWQHPRFPGRPWDAGNWLVEQKAMTDNMNGATLFGLAAKRLNGKPFTVSEYNHPAPMDSQAECVPMISSFAAAQDWDGVWLYTYSHSSDEWYRERLNSYFDIDTNPAKWGFMRAGAAIFRDASVGETGQLHIFGLADTSDVVGELAKLHIEHDRDMFEVLAERGNVTREKMLGSPIFASLETGGGLRVLNISGPKLNWSVEDGKGIFLGRGEGMLVCTGHAGRFAEATDKEVSIAGPEFAAVTVTTLDKKPFEQSQKILIAAGGRCENTGMKFSEDRRTVGRNWGEAPVRIEPVEGEVVLPKGRWKCEALGPDGMPKGEAPVSESDGKQVLELSPRNETMWYLLRRVVRIDGEG